MSLVRTGLPAALLLWGGVNDRLFQSMLCACLVGWCLLLTARSHTTVIIDARCAGVTSDKHFCCLWLLASVQCRYCPQVMSVFCPALYRCLSPSWLEHASAWYAVADSCVRCRNLQANICTSLLKMHRSNCDIQVLCEALATASTEADSPKICSSNQYLMHCLQYT